MSPEIAAREIEIAFGRNREDKNFQNQKGTFEQLYPVLTTFAVGEKDGMCMLQGALISGQRLAKNVTKNYLMLFDHDTGETLDEIEAKIRAAGLFAVLWTTYNHMQTSTLIPEDALVKWGKTSGHTGPITVTQAIEYLKETKKVQPSIFAANCTLIKDFFEGGIKYKLTHAPMPRVRSMFVLEDVFDFANRGSTQTAAIQEWKERYAGLAAQLGLVWDRSCVDPSRLMYTPRKAKDAPDGLHETRTIPGKLLNVNSIQRIETEPRGARRDPKLDALKEALGGSDQQPGTFATPGLLNFLRDHARDFEAARFLIDCDPDSLRNDMGDKIEFRCPNEDGHSTQKADDRAFMAINASAGEGFVMACQHATCKEAAKGDRAWYLDLACQLYDKTVDDLLEFCPNASRAEEKKQEAEDDLAALIDKVTITAMDHEIDVIVDALADREENMVTFGLIEKLVKNSGRKVKAIEASIKKARQKKKKEKAAEEGRDCTGKFDAPDEGTTVNAIYQHWDFSTRLKLTLQKLDAKNETEPHIFSRAEGGTVRLEKAKIGYVARPMVYSHQWLNELSKTLTFKKVTEKWGDQEIAPFDDVIAYIRGEPTGVFPVLDRIVYVPIFSPDGTLRTTKGYDAASMVYLDPKMDFLPVPDVITEDDQAEAVWWLMEALRDFPFTDVFNGSETMPVRDGQKDEDGFPLPNWERGRSSRAHMIAMILQGFVRNIIDGPCPAFHVDKPIEGTGAGFLVDVASYILLGTKPPCQTLVERAEENFKKGVTATLRGGASMIFFDNINHHVDSGIMAAALTAGVWEDRILGVSENVSIPIKATWIMTGNNLTFSPELMRRIIPIRMDADTPNPSRDRPPSWYKHADIHSWMLTNRAKLVWACHVLVSGWIQAGAPAGSKQVQSFAEWSQILGGILEHNNIPGFLENISAYLEAKNDISYNNEDLVRRIKEEFPGGTNFTALQAVRMLSNNPLEDILTPLGIVGKEEKGLAVSFGKYFRKHIEGRTYKISDSLFVKVQRPRLGNPVVYELVEFNPQLVNP